MIPSININFANFNLVENDISYLCNIFLKKMMKLDELNLYLENNSIEDDNINIIVRVLNNLSNLNNLSLDLENNLM